MKLRVVSLIVLSMFLSLSSVGISQAHAEQKFSDTELKKMSEFLDVFTILGFRTFTAKEILDVKNPFEMIHFGVWYSYAFDFDSVEKCSPAHEYGSLALSDTYVAETLKKYFDYTIKEFPSVKDPHSVMQFVWRDGKYLFNGADGGGSYLTKVEKAKKLTDGTIQMEGFLYYSEDEEDILGTFVALAKPHTFKGEDTWSMISMHVTYADKYSQSQ